MEYWYSERLDCWLLANDKGLLIDEFKTEAELLAEYPEAVKSTQMGDDE